MTTQYHLTRDCTGAASDILPFSNLIVPATNVTVQVPESNNWFVAEFSVIPDIGNISITEIQYNENPSLQLDATIYITPDLSFRKTVKGGSSLVLNKYRDQDPDASYIIYLYAI
ncbi:hypothetical protein HGB13_00315 [bacterium]|nr:hypothetical protein [bacterium]